MNSKRTMRLLVASLSVVGSFGASAQNDSPVWTLPTRGELSRILESAEGKRVPYRISCETIWHYEIDGEVGSRNETERISTGDGRHRVIQRYEHPDPEQNVINTTTWSHGESRGVQHWESDPNGPGSLGITEEFPGHQNMDEIDACLGTFLPLPRNERFHELRPSEAVRDKSVELEINEIRRDGRRLVDVFMTDPYGTWEEYDSYHTVRIVYDPNRQWLPTEFSYHLYRSREAKEAFAEVNWRLVDAEQIQGVWMPREVLRTVREGEVQPKEYPSTIRLTEIDLNPEIDESTFTISVSDLAEGSDIVDSRIGISYKLGENLIYMDGHLNRVGRPITDEITPKELKELMADAEPLIDPELVKLEAELKPVAPKGLWTNRTAYALGMIGLGVGVLGIYLFWRKQHAA